MRSRAVPLSLLVAITLGVLALQTCSLHHGMFSSNPMHSPFFQTKRFNEIKQLIADGKTPITLDFYDQLIDHMATEKDPYYKQTFRQKFYRNDQFYKENGPQFLNIGGESPEIGLMLLTGPKNETPMMMRWAENVGARAWSLEHRFYGDSRPFEKQTVENLKFLNQEQILNDLAEFIKAKNKELNMPNAKWIVFGDKLK